ncbi:hypothetical protein SNK03_008776 [Fusarium graminearum]
MATEVPQNELIPDIVYETENDNYVEFSLSPSPSRPHPPPMVQLSPSVAGKSRFKWANDGIHGSPLRSESANEVTSSATLRRIPTVQFADVTIFQGGFTVLSLLAEREAGSVSVTGRERQTHKMLPCTVISRLTLGSHHRF